MVSLKLTVGLKYRDRYWRGLLRIDYLCSDGIVPKTRFRRWHNERPDSVGLLKRLVVGPKRVQYRSRIAHYRSSIVQCGSRIERFEGYIGRYRSATGGIDNQAIHHRFTKANNLVSVE